MIRRVDGGKQVLQPPLGAGQFLVTGGKYAAGEEDVPQVVGCPGVRVGVQCLVGGGQRAGGDLGEQAGGGALAQLVERGAGCACRADRLEHTGQLGRDLAGAAGEQVGGAAAQAA